MVGPEGSMVVVLGEPSVSVALEGDLRERVGESLEVECVSAFAVQSELEPSVRPRPLLVHDQLPTRQRWAA